MRQPRAVLPSPYILMVASLSLRTSKTSGRFGLHAVGGFHGADGGFELRVGLGVGHVQLVELLDEVELVPLLLDVEAVVVDVGDELVGVEFLLLGVGRDVGRLIDRGQEAGAPERWADGGGNLRAENDEAGEIFVVGAEAVGEPGAHGGTAGDVGSGVHHDERGLVVGDFGVDGADDADVVDALADVGEELADFDAALAVALELEGRLHEGAGLALVAEVAAGHGLAVVLGEHGLGVEAVDVRQAAVHEEEDDVLCLGLEVRVLDHPRAGGIGDVSLGDRLSDDAGEAHHGESATDFAKSITASDWFRFLTGHRLASWDFFILRAARGLARSI